MSQESRPFEFAIIRILGNELPPRDLPGSRLLALDFILRNEPALPNTKKCYLLNRILDENLAETIVSTLTKHHCEYLRIDFEPEAYSRALTRDDKVRCAIEVNAARNMAMQMGRDAAEFTIILDGDCYFDSIAWESLTTGIRLDQLEHKERRIYFVPSLRCWIDEDGRLLRGNKHEEAMVVMRYDCDAKFDERLCFGRGGDKIEFLSRTKRFAKTFGHVLHVGTGERQAEVDNVYRCSVREQSLDLLLAKLDAKYHPNPNDAAGKAYSGEA